MSAPVPPVRKRDAQHKLLQHKGAHTEKRGISGPHRAELSRKGFCRNPRGIFPNKVPGEFYGGFFGGVFLGPFFFEKIREKNPPKNPRQNSNRNLGVSRPKSTLQESQMALTNSGRDQMQIRSGERALRGSGDLRGGQAP